MRCQPLSLNGQLKENKMDKDFYKSLDLPVIAAPLFLISGPEMVIECCKNGIVGTFPALNQRTTEGFEDWVIQIKDALALFEKETGKKPAPFGVNLIVHPTNIRVKADLDVCEKHKVPLIITSLGAVPQIVDIVHNYGGLVYHDIIKKRHAEKASEAGVDGLILVAAGAGGHAGTLHPIPLINEVKKIFSKNVSNFARILQTLANTCKILQNLAKSCRILQNHADSCCRISLGWQRSTEHPILSCLLVIPLVAKSCIFNASILVKGLGDELVTNIEVYLYSQNYYKSLQKITS